MRPSSIVNFERLYLTAILIDGAAAAAKWSTLAASPTSVFIRSASIVLSLLFVALASRRRSKVGRALLTASFLVGAPGAVAAVAGGGLDDPFAWILAAQITIQVVALVLLFRPQSRAWFAGEALPVSVGEVPALRPHRAADPDD